MNETDKQNASGVRVNDRRRFDPDGNPRPDGEEPQTQAQSSSAPQAQKSAERAAGAEAADSAAEAPPSANPSAKPSEVERLEQELEAARRRVDELARAIQAGERDREAFKQRVTRERERMLEVEKGKVAVALLETVDDLDLSLKAADDTPFSQGVKLIRDGILTRLQNLGVERVPLVNLPFDPSVAEAMDMEVTDDAEKDGLVLEEFRAAYRLGNQVIRDGRVKVGKYVPPAQA